MSLWSKMDNLQKRSHASENFVSNDYNEHFDEDKMLWLVINLINQCQRYLSGRKGTIPEAVKQTSWGFENVPSRYHLKKFLSPHASVIP